jgi:hypothetical protein
MAAAGATAAAATAAAVAAAKAVAATAAAGVREAVDSEMEEEGSAAMDSETAVAGWAAVR